MSFRVLIITVILAAAGLAGYAALRTQHPGKDVRAALEAHISGVDSKDASYPRMAVVMRSRAWVTAGPGQPDGPALFIALPDVQFGRERTVTAMDLREAMRRIRGLTWDPVAAVWSGDGRTVPLAEIRELLAAAAPTPSDASGIIDLLTGTRAPGLPDLAALLLAEPARLTAIRIIPFRGVCGRMLLDRGRAPYVPVDRAYSGSLALFAGQGMPEGWRILSLNAIEP